MNKNLKKVLKLLYSAKAKLRGTPMDEDDDGQAQTQARTHGQAQTPARTHTCAEPRVIGQVRPKVTKLSDTATQRCVK